MLKRLGVKEIFLPKSYPSDPSFRSASVDWTEDDDLTIPKDDLAILNATDWYEEPGFEAWEIASRHFDVAFFIVWKSSFLKSITRHFGGAKIWRAYGLPSPYTYDGVVAAAAAGRGGPIWTTQTTSDLWFGQAYQHLAKNEPRHIAERAVFLPAGLPETAIDDQWTGEDKRILFVCPDVGFNPYYQRIYEEFKRTFAGFPYAVGGAQSIRLDDDRVLGFVSSEQHRQNMRRLALMFYHGTEPNHVHYHPFEAVRTGMPLVFMAGGLLDRMGGLKLPGRCETPAEARDKVKRILAGDRRLIGDIRQSQTRLLDAMTAQYCEPFWRTGLDQVLRKHAEARPALRAANEKRIAIILPVGYRGGSLRGAKLLAQAIRIGSEQHGQPVRVVFGHIDDPTCYPDEEFADLPEQIERRPYRWRTMTRQEASHACAYAGVVVTLDCPAYSVPDDGINQFLDCDLWLIVPDRLSAPLLPVRPYVLMVYDYLQRYMPMLDEANNQQYISAALAAEAVLVTTEFTAADARQYAGVPASRVKKVPLLAPDFNSERSVVQANLSPGDYFIWTSNLAPHKNHQNALKGLRLYYEKYDGKLDCHVTGVDTKEMFKRDAPHLKQVSQIRHDSKAIRKRLIVRGELPDQNYRHALREAAFLWHPATIDNGTFSVVEAACFGVPSLSSDYPAMREIDKQFRLNLAWFDPNDPGDIGRKLKDMELVHEEARRALPAREILANQSTDRFAGAYWKAIREYL
ncbi:glycosyltransferase [Bradyrhizobium sp. HKCCYLS2038]|uniref:glycosyltransferase n=1 Tax=unclassified Bradyrhizobium TaxID=2631580 RepID=UPI003EC0CD6C